MSGTEGKTQQRSDGVKAGETTQGLSAKDWASIQAQVDQSRYRLEPSQQTVSGANPEQGWALQFDAYGLRLSPSESRSLPGSPYVEFREAKEPDARLVHGAQPRALTPRDSTSALRLRTTDIGRANTLSSVAGAAPVVHGSRVELHHTQATEWYINSAAGLEHGYTFEHAPGGARGEVRIGIAVDGGLTALAAPDGDGVLLADAGGARKMRYNKLLVLDADGRALDARLQAEDPKRLLIAFDDRTARYPVIVDPLLVARPINYDTSCPRRRASSFGPEPRPQLSLRDWIPAFAGMTTVGKCVETYRSSY